METESSFCVYFISSRGDISENHFLRTKTQLVVEYGADSSPKDVVADSVWKKDKADPSLGRFSKWNLNTIGYKPEGSLLGLECDGNISGITMPWIYFGMMFCEFFHSRGGQSSFLDVTTCIREVPRRGTVYHPLRQRILTMFVRRFTARVKSVT